MQTVTVIWKEKGTQLHSIPQYTTVYHSIPQYTTQYTTVYHSISHYTTVYYSTSQYNTAYHSIVHNISQYITVYHSISCLKFFIWHFKKMKTATMLVYTKRLASMVILEETLEMFQHHCYVCQDYGLLFTEHYVYFLQAHSSCDDTVWS